MEKPPEPKPPSDRAQRQWDHIVGYGKLREEAAKAKERRCN